MLQQLSTADLRPIIELSGDGTAKESSHPAKLRGVEVTAGLFASTFWKLVEQLPTLVLGSVLLITSVGISLSQSSRDWDDCLARGDVSSERQFGACDTIMKGGRETGVRLATAFEHRGNALQRKRLYDEAI